MMVPVPARPSRGPPARSGRHRSGRSRGSGPGRRRRASPRPEPRRSSRRRAPAAVFRPRVRVPDRGHEFAGVLDLQQPLDRAADGQGGEVRQTDVGSHLHGPTLARTTLRTGERGGERAQAAGIAVASSAPQGAPARGRPRPGARTADPRDHQRQLAPPGGPVAARDAGATPAGPRAAARGRPGVRLLRRDDAGAGRAAGSRGGRPGGRRPRDRPRPGGRRRGRPRPAARRLPRRRLRAGGAAAGARARVQRAPAVRRGVRGQGVDTMRAAPRPAGSSSRAPATRTAFGVGGAGRRRSADTHAGHARGGHLAALGPGRAAAQGADPPQRPGQPVHEFLRAFDAAWAAAAGLSASAPGSAGWPRSRRSRSRAGRWWGPRGDGGTARRRCDGRRSRRRGGRDRST